MALSAALTPDEEAQHRRALDRVGSVLVDKWHLDALLGMGGMAAVYSATHRNGRRVAIKILHSELTHVAEIRERFLEEAYAANRVQHPGTVPVLDDGVTAEGSAFLVMDLLEGETLDARMQRAGRALSAVDVLSLMDALLDVLAAAHDKGMVHRDVKPENVFLTTDGSVKLLDFGIARMRESRRTLRTQTGATVGTPAFMSPEQARGRWEQLDARSDLWSVGATMYVLLTGSVVHDAETLNEQLLAAMTRPAPSLRSVAPLVPDCVARIVDQALAFTPDNRFENALAMQSAVRAAYAELAQLAAAEGRQTVPPLAGGPIEPAYPTQRTTYRPVTSTEWPRAAQRRLVVPAGVAALVLGAGILIARTHWHSVDGLESGQTAPVQAQPHASDSLSEDLADASPTIESEASELQAPDDEEQAEDGTGNSEPAQAALPQKPSTQRSGQSQAQTKSRQLQRPQAPVQQNQPKPQSGASKSGPSQVGAAPSSSQNAPQSRSADSQQPAASSSPSTDRFDDPLSRRR